MHCPDMKRTLDKIVKGLAFSNNRQNESGEFGDSELEVMNRLLEQRVNEARDKVLQWSTTVSTDK